VKTEVISFRKELTGSQSVRILERVKANGEVRELRIRFYTGQEHGLWVQAYVLHTGNRREEFVTFAGDTNNFFSGDDDYFVFPSNTLIKLDDELVVEATNVSGFNYHMIVDIVVHYHEVEGL
jgi:hypothetical protein